MQLLTHTQYPDKVNVWLGIIDNSLIGPYFIEGNLNARKFLDLLRDQVLPAIRNLDIQESWFQMDGAPAHSTNEVTNFLNAEFQERWIGRYGPIRWPARSPDLSPNDFFIWGYLKSKVYTNV